MNKRVLILYVLIICVAFQTVAFAERESASYSIDIVFGGERFTNVFNIEWDTEETYEPYGYGVTESWRQTALRDGKEAYSPIIIVMHGDYPYHVVGHHELDGYHADEIIVVIDGKTYRGCIGIMSDTSALEYRDAGGILNDSDLRPQGMFAFPKGSRYDTFYFPDEYAIWDQGYGAGEGKYFEYVEVFEGWYKTADGKWYKDSELHQLTEQEISELFGAKNPVLFRYGDTDSVIGQIQEKLRITITNEFDDKTLNALRNYQDRHGLLYSGLLDQKTYDSLMK